MEDFKLDITVDCIIRRLRITEIEAIGHITELHRLVRIGELENKMENLLNYIAERG